MKLNTYLGKRLSNSKDCRLLAFCCFFLCDDIARTFDVLSFYVTQCNKLKNCYYIVYFKLRGAFNKLNVLFIYFIVVDVFLYLNAFKASIYHFIEIVSDWFTENLKFEEEEKNVFRIIDLNYCLSEDCMTIVKIMSKIRKYSPFPLISRIRVSNFQFHLLF